MSLASQMEVIMYLHFISFLRTNIRMLAEAYRLRIKNDQQRE